jgi:hypothetical protein
MADGQACRSLHALSFERSACWPLWPLASLDPSADSCGGVPGVDAGCPAAGSTKYVASQSSRSEIAVAPASTAPPACPIARIVDVDCHPSVSVLVRGNRARAHHVTRTWVPVLRELRTVEIVAHRARCKGAQTLPHHPRAGCGACHSSPERHRLSAIMSVHLNAHRLRLAGAAQLDDCHKHSCVHCHDLHASARSTTHARMHAPDSKHSHMRRSHLYCLACTAVGSWCGLLPVAHDRAACSM